MKYLYPKNFKFYKLTPCKKLIISKPEERFVINLTYLPNDLLESKKLFIY